MKKNLLRIVSILILGLLAAPRTEASSSETYKTQSKIIQEILEAEKNTEDHNNIISIISAIDATYKNLHQQLLNKKKIVIFFDPAHGKLSGGQWQGGRSTFRASCTDLPEEFYSIQISQKMYERLTDNPFIEVKSTEDFMSVLQKRSGLYSNIPFSDTVKLAEEAGAFIIISEHLNNVATIHKAGGLSNIPGIHITSNEWGQKFLRHIKLTHSGFLTLYNKLDASGFSKSYALLLKEKLIAQGLKPNSWEFGAVGDSRFSYFVDFPVSVIFESGFISNPIEEKKLRNHDYINTIVDAQYNAFIQCIRDIFSVDISGKQPQNLSSADERVELLKLSRIAVYYLKKGDSQKGIRIIGIMEKCTLKSIYRENIAYFSSIKASLLKSEALYNLGKKINSKSKKAQAYYTGALKQVRGKPLLAYYADKYCREIPQKKKKGSTLSAKPDGKAKKKNGDLNAGKTTPMTAIILTIEDNKNLRESIQRALEPDEQTLEKLLASFQRARITKIKNSRIYSRKRKRWTTIRKKVVEKISFSTGIYIIGLDKNLNVTAAQKVTTVHLNPEKYQNQQYLKNSCFAHETKERTL